MKGKIIEGSDIISTQLRWQGKRIILVGGCYDLLHYGHFSFLKAAKNEGDILVVALESDEFITKRKKRNPVHTQQQRAEILSGLEFVDIVLKLPFMKSDEDYRRLVEDVKPAIIAVTEGDSQLDNKKSQAAAIGAELKVVSPMVHSFSTSSIIEYANLLRD